MTPRMVIETSRPRPGRRFMPTDELALEGPALKASGSLPGAHRGLMVIRELVGPLGIPDFTALVGDQARLTARLAADISPLLHEVDAAIVAVAHQRSPRSAESLAGALGWPLDTVARRLPFVLRAGALLEVKPQRYVRHPAISPVGRVYAIEAKVRDWTKALRQARAYSVWADSYVIVMGPLAARTIDRLVQEVELDQGGLVVDDRWIRKPSIHPLPASRRLWASEYLVAAIVGNYDDQPSSCP